MSKLNQLLEHIEASKNQVDLFYMAPKDIVQEVFKQGVYCGVFPEETVSKGQQESMVWNLFSMIEKILESSKQSTLLKNLFDVINKSDESTQACFYLTTEMVEELFNLGVKTNVFESKNFGLHDKKNSVYCFVSTLFHVNKEKLEESLIVL